MTPQELAYTGDQYAKMFHQLAAETAATEIKVGAIIDRSTSTNKWYSSLPDSVSTILQSFTPAETVQIALGIIGLYLIYKKA
jgi:hypothetical protein